MAQDPDATPVSTLGRSQESPVLDATQTLSPPPGEDEVARAGESPGLGANERIGPYRVLDRLGEGGMGQVFLAERADGEIERQVAIKVMRSTVDSAEAAARFQAERQILAQLDHPAIARLYDVGTTEQGQAYLVMEAVEGVPIDRYCFAQDLGLDARIALFREVLAAVEHAHQRLVVHRDLKPSNLLVTPDGRPKLLDFGIAKGLTPDGDALDLTRTAFGPHTPRWAAPEQIHGDPITTATDVYSLGVLLFHLLSGGHPRTRRSLEDFVEEAATPVEPVGKALRRRRERGAPIPWTTDLADTAERRLRGDLEAIVAKALRFEPGERYASVSAFDEDLRRWQATEPVRARHGNVTYRVGKWLRRHAWPVAAALVVVLVIGAATVAVWRQRDQALASLARAEQSRTVLSDILRGAALQEESRGAVGLDRLLADAVAEVQERDDLVAVEKVELLGLLGSHLTTRGRLSVARESLDHALALLEACTSCSASTRLELSLQRAELSLELSEYAEAERFFGEATAQAERLGPDQVERVAVIRARLERSFYQSADFVLADSIRCDAERMDQAEARASCLITLLQEVPSLRSRNDSAGVRTLGDWTHNAALSAEFDPFPRDPSSPRFEEASGAGAAALESPAEQQSAESAGRVRWLYLRLRAATFEASAPLDAAQDSDTLWARVQQLSRHLGLREPPPHAIHSRLMIAEAEGDLAAVREVLADAREMAAAEPDGLRSQFNLLLAEFLLVRMGRDEIESSEAERWLADLVERGERLSSENPNPHLRMIYAYILLEANRIEAAKPVVREVLEDGQWLSVFVREAKAKGAFPDDPPPRPRVDLRLPAHVHDWLASYPPVPPIETWADLEAWIERTEAAAERRDGTSRQN